MFRSLPPIDGPSPNPDASPVRRSVRVAAPALLAAAAAALLTVGPGPMTRAAVAQPARTGAPAPVAPSPYTYADVADLADVGPLVIDVRVRRLVAIPPERAPGVRAGAGRALVEADVNGLIRGTAALAARISFLADLPVDARGRLPKLGKQRLILFARPAPGTVASVQLAAPDAMLPWTPGTDALVRRILAEMAQNDAPPAITGIANGFHVAGTLPGTGETQLFLRTSTGDPVSLTVVRAAGAAPVWSAAFGEIVDQSAAIPGRDTLGWYRLACGLPRTLPMGVLAGTGEAERAVAAEDYRFILTALGNCPRTRTPPTATR